MGHRDPISNRIFHTWSMLDLSLRAFYPDSSRSLYILFLFYFSETGQLMRLLHLCYLQQFLQEFKALSTSVFAPFSLYFFCSWSPNLNVCRGILWLRRSSNYLLTSYICFALFFVPPKPPADPHFIYIFLVWWSTQIHPPPFPARIIMKQPNSMNSFSVSGLLLSWLAETSSFGVSRDPAGRLGLREWMRCRWGSN